MSRRLVYSTFARTTFQSPSLRSNHARASVRVVSSVAPDSASLSQLPDIDVAKLEITQTTSPKELVPPEELVFGRTFTGTAALLQYAFRSPVTDAGRRPHAFHRMDSI